jgi:hypothetical protein
MNPEYKKKIEEAEAQARFLAAQREKERPVSVPNMERMPLGCWVVIILAGIGIFLLFSKGLGL